MAPSSPMAPLAVGLVLAAAGALLVASGWRGAVPIGLVLAAATLLAVGVARAAREERRRRAEVGVLAVPPPSAATLSELREPVLACPACGETRLLALVRDHPGGQVECPRCAYLGEPLHFPRKEEYAAFMRELSTANLSRGARMR